MKTIRRDKLLRLARNGKLVTVSSYSFDDMHGASRSKTERPVAIIPEGNPDWWKERKEGVAYLHASDFTGSGRAWENPNGTITLIVHSNLNYDFRVAA
jgi:hypothetical protein